MATCTQATALDGEDKLSGRELSGTVLPQGSDLDPVRAAPATGRQGPAHRKDLAKQGHEGSHF